VGKGGGRAATAVRQPGEKPLNAIGACHFTPGDRGLLLFTRLFGDGYGLGYLPLNGDGQVRPVVCYTTAGRRARSGPISPGFPWP
jgi:hypothetical protein